MNRKIKNIIMITIILLLCGCIVFTMNLAKNSTTTTNDTQSFNMNGTPPGMPNGDNSTNTPPEKPDGDNSTNTDTPPEKPDGDSSTNTNTPPEKPDDSSTSNEGTPPEMPNGENNNYIEVNDQISYAYYIAFGIESFIISYLIMYLILSKFNAKSFKETYVSTDKILITILSVIILTSALTYASIVVNNKYFTNESSSQNNNQNPGMNNNDSSNVTYSSAYEITSSETISEKSYTSNTKDENALSISGDVDVTLSKITASKTGDSDGGDSTSFYGTNSAIIASSGANVTITDATITTDATGANGVFSYGGSATTQNSSSDGTTVVIKNSTITTSKDNSGGIMTTGGGIMKAYNLTINTSGVSSAAIRSDRGGGSVLVDGGTYKTTGAGSPAIYSTADITVSNAKLISNASEGIVIEGKNSVTINNTDLVDSNTKLNGQSTTYKNVFLYQSMSGDADTGVATFSSKDSKISTNNGDSFYVTNTKALITLENTEVINNDTTGNFLRVQADSWGTKGSNGGDVTLTLTNQTAKGNIVIDEVSTLELNITNNSYYEGIINGENQAKSIILTLDKTSKIKLTGNSYITSINDELTDYSNIDFNGYKLYVNGVAIN